MKKLFKKCTLLLLVVCSTSLIAEELVLNTESTFNPTHDNRYSFMLGFNSSLTRAADLSNFAFSYGKQLENYWLDTNVLMTKGLFGEFSANNQPATQAAASQLETQENSLLTIGVGVGRETRYAQTLLPFEDIYEYMAANITYNKYNEDFSGYSFTGPGLLAKFSLYKKFNEYFSAGTHFNYNLAVVKREQQNNETSSERSLTLGFLTIGFDISFYL